MINKNKVAGVSLTDEQWEAVQPIVPRQLLVAAAGSGKTATMVAKIAYAVQTAYCHPAQILALAFNKKAAQELDQRLELSLGWQHGVKSSTVHALGLAIVTQVEKERPSVSHPGSNDQATAMLMAVLTRLLHSNMCFVEQWLLFKVFFSVLVRHPDEFKYKRQWHHYLAKNSLYGSSCGFLSVRKEVLDTQFEQAIANFLHLHDVSFQYRFKHRSYSICYTLAKRWIWPLKGHKGFYLPAYKKWVFCVYKCQKQASLSDIYISLSCFRAGNAFGLLKKQLQLSSRATPLERLTAIFPNETQYASQTQQVFLLRFLHLARLNNNQTFCLADRKTYESTRMQLHRSFLQMLYKAYAEYLSQQKTIDFTGMLERAIHYVDSGRYQHSYRLILIDEFQDTSAVTVRLLQALLAQNPQCSLFAVGDDWQSIYRFAGAMPDVLQCFESYFGSAKIDKLTKTFRFGQSIANISSEFVCANPVQLKKEVQAFRVPEHDAIILLHYFSDRHQGELCETILKQAQLQGYKHVFILGRYQYQRPEALATWQQQFPFLCIEFQTMHAAKGLEADVVIILGLEATRRGFPSQQSDDVLMQLVFSSQEVFPYAEERRLFYVALTRTRSTSYVLTSASSPSLFAQQLQALSPTVIAAQ